MTLASSEEPPASASMPAYQHAERAAFVGFCITLIWAPWPLGSNRPWALAVLAAMVWAGAALAVVGGLLRAAHWGTSAPRRRLEPGAWVPTAALVAFAGLVACQLLPGLGAGGGAVSIDAFHTRRYLLTTLTYVGAWVTVLLLVQERSRAERLLSVVMAAGVAQAMAAVVLYAASAPYELWFTPFTPGGRASATFANPDHLAGYMELCLSAGLGWLLSQLAVDGVSHSRGWRAGAVGVLRFILSAKMLLRLLLVVMVIALVMTHSRMGNGAFFISMALVGLVVAAASRRLRRPAMWLVLSMVVVDLFIIGQWVGLDRVVQRLQDTVEASPEPAAGFGLGTAPAPREQTLIQRLEVPKLSLQLVAQRPWFGWGGGTYYTAFPPYKVPGLPLHWDHAHNDYVQVACDTGLVGLALWVGVALATLVRTLKLIRDGQPPANRGVGIAALMAISCLALHSMVDFNLHIPANAITFTVLLALVWVVPVVRRSRRKAVSAGAARVRAAGQAA